MQLITYEALGLCGEGKAGEFIDKGDNTYGGRVVVNPSGRMYLDCVAVVQFVMC